MACIKIKQVTDATTEGKRYYSRSIEDKGSIKMIRETFHIEPPKINLTHGNHTLENVNIWEIILIKSK